MEVTWAATQPHSVTRSTDMKHYHY